MENWLCQIGWHAIRIPSRPHERKKNLKTTQGLDEPDMVHVVNYDLPNAIDNKEHRTSRRRTSLLSNL